MPIYKLKKDELVQQWWRDYYEIEANSEEEAVQQILNDEVDSYDSDMIDSTRLDPDQIIIENDYDEVLYDSKK